MISSCINSTDSSSLPKVSVVVPIYNTERFLERCLDSLLGQKYSNLEIILVDDGSTDSSADICDRYAFRDSRFRVVHKANGGLSSARNAGIDCCSGDLLCFVDSDDWISEEMISYMVGLHLKHAADIVSVTYTLAKRQGEYTQKDYQEFVYNRADALEAYLEMGMGNRVNDYPVWTKMYRRRLFDSVRFPLGKIYEDMATNIKLIVQSSVYVKSTRVCYFYFQGGSSIIRSPFKKRDTVLIDVCQEMYDLCHPYGKRYDLLSEQKIARSYLSLLIKIAVYGFSDDFSKGEKKSITSLYTKELRKRFSLLIKSKMPLNRKIAMLLVCINYRLLVPARLLIRKGK